MLTLEQQKEKNRRIGVKRNETSSRRASMSCKSVLCKINKNTLRSSQSELLKMFFVEYKWAYNYILSKHDGEGLLDVNDTYKELNTVITHKDKDKNDIQVKLSRIGSSIKQAVVEQRNRAITGLAKLKENGYEVGKLKFKKEIFSIDLKQYKVTHTVVGKNKIKLQGIKLPLRVSGLNQLSKYKNIEYSNAKLLYDGYDYYIALTVYVDNDKKKPSYKNKYIGLDFGIQTTITTSNGDKYDVQVEETDRLKRLQTILNRKVKWSNNWKKTRSLIRKEYTHISNIKDDTARKIVHKLINENEMVIFQDDPINTWNKEEHKGQIQHSILGRVKDLLLHKDNVVVLDQYYPTSKYCFDCGTKNDNLTLKDRIFVCSNCGHIEDRDVHAAKNMVQIYLNYINIKTDTVGTTDTDKKPLEIKYDSSLLWSKFESTKENTGSLALC